MKRIIFVTLLALGGCSYAKQSELVAVAQAHNALSCHLLQFEKRQYPDDKKIDEMIIANNCPVVGK